jgi:hypothetical protein
MQIEARYRYRRRKGKNNYRLRFANSFTRRVSAARKLRMAVRIHD